jgi:TonB family protein
MTIKAGNSSGIFGNRNGGVNPRAKWSAYASTAQARILDELRRNPKTRKAALRVEIRIWPDSTGRISRASLGTSSGDPAVDAALRDEILTGLQLSQPPPEGMPTPIVMRVTARRPN